MKQAIKDIIESQTTKDIIATTKVTISDAVKTDAFKKVAGGAAAGALVGSLVPVVGTVAMAGVGACIGAYKWITE